MTPEYVQKKRAEVEDMRKQALTANGIGKSLLNLAPVVGGELRATVGLLLRTGKLKAEWVMALEAAHKSSVEDSDRTLAAVAIMLTRFSEHATKRIKAHGNELGEQGAQLTGKANGIEEMLAEAVEQQAQQEDEPRA